KAFRRSKGPRYPPDLRIETAAALVPSPARFAAAYQSPWCRAIEKRNSFKEFLIHLTAYFFY
ncbi:hypothetical protein, partial [Acidisoma silvae]|uniref:hypothetical protein n=1 Tax=Acidisoma silvae TaxID=2802396 RepID=UPI001D0A306D